MNLVTLSRNYAEPPICEREILRYAGCRGADENISALLSACISETRERLCYKVCWCELPVSVKDGVCDLGALRVHSENLSANLDGCSSVILFAATIGTEIERLTARYSHISPSKAVMLQAFGAERIEALCDAFCEDIAQEKRMYTKPRFSPGYGDLPIELQKDIFAVLGCTKRIGVSLGESLLMSPSKSVTAFLGLTAEGKMREEKNIKCSACDKQDCAFRGAI